LAAIKEQIDFDWEGAYREHMRAVELNPGYATAHHWYALHLIWTGKREEAIAEIKLAQELDPLSLIININVGAILYYSRLYDQALEQLRSTLELFPNAAPAFVELGMCYLAKGKYEEGIAALKEAMTLEEGFLEYKAQLGYAYAVSGRRDKALKIIDELRGALKQKYVSPYFIAAVYKALDEKDTAFQWLERAYEERDVNVIYLKVDPVFDPLRSDPRFKALLKKLNLE